MVFIQHSTAETPEPRNPNIFPAEMDSKVRHACIPRRANTGEEVEALVQEEHPGRGAHVSQISS
jgi:hypothetical protein